MKKWLKTLIIIAVIAAALVALYFGVIRRYLPGEKEGSGEVAYVTKVADIMGVGGGFGMLNRFAGVVESQETWSVKQNQDYTIKEVLVKVGDNVDVGTPLFSYDIDKFESDLKQAEIDLERLENELESLNKLREQLEKDSKKAPASEKSNYTIQIEEQDLSIKQKEIDIETKRIEIQKLKDNMAHSTVTSELKGVVKTVNNNQNMNYYEGSDDSFITIMKVGDLRVKGSINEQNMYDITPGAAVVVYSRADSSLTWRGYIDRIDTENAQQSQNMYGGGDAETQSSKYPFYVILDDSEGLMLGQHVYMELDLGQADEEEADKDQVRLGEYYIDMTDPDAPFVWVDEEGKLAKRNVVLGEYNEDMMEYIIVSGLTLEDAIAMPEETLEEGMTTADIAEFVYEDEGMTDGGMTDEVMMNNTEDVMIVNEDGTLG